MSPEEQKWLARIMLQLLMVSKEALATAERKVADDPSLLEGEFCWMPRMRKAIREFECGPDEL